MAAKVGLKDLIEALAGAVIEAQDQIEQHQIANLGGYFDEDNRPKSVLIRLPSMHPDSQPGEEEFYRAPLLPLVSTNLLRIKDVEIRFEVELGQLLDDLPDNPSATARSEAGSEAQTWHVPPRARHRNVQVHTRTGLMGRKGATLQVMLRVEGSEPTDGAARLLAHLAQTQGVVKTVKPD